MAVNFPDSPSNGDSFSVNDTTYVYNATAGYWDITSTVQVSASTSTNAPSNPSSGDLWFDPSSLTTYIYYNDGTSSQWVPANSVGARGPAGPGYPTAYYSADYTSTSTGNVVFNANSTPSLASYSIGKVNVWVNGVLRSDFIASDGSNVEIALSTGDEVKIVNFGDTDVLDVTASSNDYATYTSLTSNDYSTYTTLSSLIDTVQSNVSSGGSGVVVYATPDLLPLSGNDAGDQAYVSSTNRLYINTGSGWYSIGLVNTNPNITSVQDANGGVSPFVLSSSGTATVITITASDPEEVPLTYSYAVTSGSLTNGGGTTATVAQGTGANTNQFTITPTTNAYYGGTFNLTFTVSDGVNTSTSANVFTLQFTIPNSKYTTLLATAVDTSDNNNITDSSTNNHTVTVNGDAHAGTFSPYRHGGYSTYFDGTGDYITAPPNTSFDFGTGDFTIEAWIYPTALSGNHLIVDTYVSGDNGSFQLYWRSTGNSLAFYTPGDGVFLQDPSSSNIVVNTWNHVAVSRSGTSAKLFVNGTVVDTITNSRDLTHGNTLAVGAQIATGTNYFSGFITDVRIVKGTAVYTSTFTPPTERLTSITNTSLLTCHLPYIADGSTNDHTITVNGNTSTKPFGPYDYEEYASSDNGGSVYFDGNGDWLRVPDSTDWDLDNTSNWTVEGWFYRTSNSGEAYLLAQGEQAINGNYVSNIIALSNTSTIAVNSIMMQVYNSGNRVVLTTPANSIKVNQWHHLAVQYSSSAGWSIYLDGKDQTLTALSGTDSASSTTWGWTNSGLPSGPLYIGTRSYNQGADGYVDGYLSDWKWTPSVQYSSNFTPPTSPSSSTNALFHLKGTDASIIDKSQTNNLKLFGNTTGSTTEVKFAGSKSMYFDGNGDRINLDANNSLYDLSYGQGDFTIEGWFYFNSHSNDTKLYIDVASATTYWQLTYWVSTGLKFSANVTGINVDAGSTLSLNTWYHIALVRNSSTYNVYVDGTSVISTTTTHQIGSNSEKAIGGTALDATASLDGYIQDFRLTKGLARYTANFTPPIAPFAG